MALERESGKVHWRLRMKLLVTAARKEMTLARTGGKPSSAKNRLKVRKSTPAPMAPTIEKRKKRFHSRVLPGKFIAASRHCEEACAEKLRSADVAMCPRR